MTRDSFEDASSPACLSLAAEWLSTCRTSHTDCALEHKMSCYLPKRIIHVGTGTAHPFLYIPNQQTIGSWVALSYCWGGASDFTLTQSRLADFQLGFPLEDFPNTIRDAIIVTRALGYQYLWVDALCILQYDESDLDQTSKLDWVTEAPKMADIYRDAIVTIEATASPAVTSGILHKRVVPASATLPWKIPQVNPSDQVASRHDQELPALQIQVCQARDPWQHIIDYDSNWETRGWTLQESLLSSRTLTFTSRQMIWHCRSLWVVESGSSRIGIEAGSGFTEFRWIESLPNSMPDDTDQADKTFLLYQWWHRIVTVYCQRKLTYVTDKLPAIAGFAKRIQDALPEQDYYCAGIWRRNLVTELLWYIDIGNRDIRDFSEPPSVYVGPSWSWVNVGGYICFKTIKRDPDRRVIELAAIKNVQIIPNVPGDMYGCIRSARLDITAPYIRLRTLCKPGNHGPFQHFLNYIFGDPRSQLAYEYKQQHKPYPGQHFAVLQLVKYLWDVSFDEGSIKKPAMELLFLESDSRGENLYRRIGQASLREAKSICDAEEWDEHDDAFKDGDIANDVGTVEHRAFLNLRRQKWKSKTVCLI